MESNLEQKLILFFTVPLKEPIANIESVLVDDKILHEAIKTYSKQLEQDKIETFKLDRNMIVTEDGYKLAIYGNKDLYPEIKKADS